MSQHILRPRGVLSGPKECPRVGPESSLKGICGALPLELSVEIVCELSNEQCIVTCEYRSLTVSYVSVYGRRQGLEQTVSALWVKGEHDTINHIVLLLGANL